MDLQLSRAAALPLFFVLAACGGQLGPGSTEGDKGEGGRDERGTVTFEAGQSSGLEQAKKDLCGKVIELPTAMSLGADTFSVSSYDHPFFYAKWALVLPERRPAILQLQGPLEGPRGFPQGTSSLKVGDGIYDLADPPNGPSVTVVPDPCQTNPSYDRRVCLTNTQETYFAVTGTVERGAPAKAGPIPGRVALRDVLLVEGAMTPDVESWHWEAKRGGTCLLIGQVTWDAKGPDGPGPVQVGPSPAGP